MIHLLLLNAQHLPSHSPEDRVKTLDDIVQFTQTDPRESPEGYEGVQRFISELPRRAKSAD